MGSEFAASKRRSMSVGEAEAYDGRDGGQRVGNTGIGN